MAFTPINSNVQSNKNPDGSIQAGFRPVTIGGIPVEPKQKKAPFNVQDITKTLGLGGAVETLGTNFAQIGNALDPRTSLAQKVERSQIIGNTSLEQNVGTGVQLGATVAGGLGGAPISLSRSIGTGALVGGAMTGGQAASENASANEVVKRGGIGALVGGAVSGAVTGIGKLLGKIGDKITTTVIRPSEHDKMDGFSLDTIKKYDLGGSLNKTLKKTQSKLTDLTTQLKSKLAEGSSPVNMQEVVDETIKDLTDSSKLKGFGANKKILNVLENLKEEVGIVGNELSIPDAQVVKQASGGFGAWQYGKPDPDSKATEIVYNTFYSKLKTAIEKASPEGVRGINHELSQLIPVMNAVLRRIPVAERNNLISLSDMVGLVGSAHNPIALGPTLLNIISKSGTAGNLIGKTAQPIAGSALPIATGASVIDQSVLQGEVQSPDQPQSGIEASENRTKPRITVNDDGTWTIPAPFSGKPMKYDPMMGLGMERVAAKITGKAAVEAADILKDFLVKELPKAGSLKGTMNAALGDEAKAFLQFLKSTKDVSLAEMQKGLEIIRLQGKPVGAITDAIMDTSDSSLKYLRDALGRFAK